MYVKGDDCAGGKRSKERITVALCASMTGEKLIPLVIAKSNNPRCFKKIKKETLPVTYRANNKAWMTRFYMEEWLKKLNRQMKRQKRKILLFLDNAPSHPRMELNHVEIKFLPPNITSKAQPMDQGIIQATKLKFRKKQLQFMIQQMEKHESKTGSQILKDISLLDAIF